MARCLLRGIDLSADDVARHRYEVIAWLVRENRLQIRVGLPCDGDGVPLAAGTPEADRYFHSKWGVLRDAAGDRLVFSGSINESAAGWKGNFESFTVYRSWESEIWDRYGQPQVDRFEQLWQGVGMAGWRSVPLPEAVESQLVGLLPDDADFIPVARDPLEAEPLPIPAASEADVSLVHEIRAAPRSCTGVGLVSAGIVPWPHQTAISRRIVDRWPRSYLLADEVGLGKTIEVGLALRELLLSGRARSALLLVPASLLVQWQEELLEKFLLDVPRLEGANLYWANGATKAAGDGPERWRASPVLLASSHLARRAARREHLLGGEGWDLVFVDEAHHARRRGAATNGHSQPVAGDPGSDEAPGHVRGALAGDRHSSAVADPGPVESAGPVRPAGAMGRRRRRHGAVLRESSGIIPRQGLGTPADNARRSHRRGWAERRYAPRHRATARLGGRGEDRRFCRIRTAPIRTPRHPS